LYDELTRKLNQECFKKRPGNFASKLICKRDRFIELNCDNQIKVLSELFDYFGTTPVLGDFSLIGEGANVGILIITSNFDLVKNSYSIINQSVTGLYEKVTRLS
jgi:hypothetical protein